MYSYLDNRFDQSIGVGILEYKVEVDAYKYSSKRRNLSAGKG